MLSIVCVHFFPQNHQTLTKDCGKQFEWWFGTGVIFRHFVLATLNLFSHFLQSSFVHRHVCKCFSLKCTTKFDACLKTLEHDFTEHFFLGNPSLDPFTTLGLCCNLKCSVKFEALVNSLLQIEQVCDIFTLNYHKNTRELLFHPNKWNFIQIWCAYEWGNVSKLICLWT